MMEWKIDQKKANMLSVSYGGCWRVLQRVILLMTLADVWEESSCCCIKAVTWILLESVCVSVIQSNTVLILIENFA